MLKTKYLFNDKNEMINFLINIYENQDYFNSPLSYQDIEYLNMLYENEIYVKHLNKSYLQVGQIRDWIIILCLNGNFLIVKKEIWEN